jgi:hypothetical protein
MPLSTIVSTRFCPKVRHVLLIVSYYTLSLKTSSLMLFFPKPAFKEPLLSRPSIFSPLLPQKMSYR